MNPRLDFLGRCSIAAAAVLVCYLVSFWLFFRVHLTTGRMTGMSITMSFLEVRDTRLNRCVVAFYAPILRLPGLAIPVEWE